MVHVIKTLISIFLARTSRPKIGGVQCPPVADQRHATHLLVMTAGGWLAPQLVLIAPIAVEGRGPQRRMIQINLISAGQT